MQLLKCTVMEPGKHLWGGGEFYNWGATTEKSLPLFTTNVASADGRTWRRAPPADLISRMVLQILWPLSL